MQIRLVPPDDCPTAWPVNIEMPHAPRIGEKICHPQLGEYREVVEVNYAFDDAKNGVYPLSFVGVKLR